MNRQCGGCTLCCKLVPVRSLRKPANHKCTYQTSKGCGVYHKPGFPPECGMWSCRWLTDDDTSTLHRPDRAHYVVDDVPDLVTVRDDTGATPNRDLYVVQVWVDPAHPDAWQDKALLHYIEHRGALHGEAMLVRFGSAQALAVIPPSLSADKGWIVTRSTVSDSPSITGNRLLDQLVQRTRQREVAR